MQGAGIGLPTGVNPVTAACSGSRMEQDGLSMRNSALAGGNTGSLLRNRSSSTVTGGDRKSRDVFKVRSVSASEDTLSTTTSGLPIKEIPGSYGLPFFGAFKDKLDFYWFQGTPKYYESRRDKYKSTVFRGNTVPGPPGFPDPRVIFLLDEKSFPVLFDVSKVEKRDVFTGTYMPDVKYNGGYRILPYLDPSEEKHGKLKAFCFEVLKSSSKRIFPEFHSFLADVFTAWEADLKKDGKADTNKDLPLATLRFNVKAFLNQDPVAPGEHSLGTGVVLTTKLWQVGQLAPVAIIPIPKLLAPLVPLVELLLHTFPLPFFLFKSQYTKLVNFFQTYGKALLDVAEKQFDLNRDEATHNLLFYTMFNSWGGIDLLFPTIVKRVGSTSAEFQRELAAEVKEAVEKNGGLNPMALSDMPLVQSAVYEVLRIDPPVPYQYGRAKEDLIVESHEAAFQVKKGEMLAGFMPLACRDPKVFSDPLTYQPKRFLGDEGKKLLQYVLWSNGPQTESPSLENKHCAGKNFILTISQLFVAEIYSKYETLEVNPADGVLTSLKLAPA